MTYSLVNSYAGDALINGFNWVDTHDYSNGFVRYQSQTNAAAQGLFAVDEQTGVVRLGADHTNRYTVTEGRPSIRIESKVAYNHGLFIADFLHMPPSQCGVWPAFWAYGDNWPHNGEIDIIEGANNAHRNIISAHTTPGCLLGEDVLSMASGISQTRNCDVGTDNIGCGYVPPSSDTTSYGDSFNAVGGGIYAMLWDDEFIQVWHFNRDEAPADIAAKKPQPDNWGKPQAVYGGQKCDVKSHFRDMNIVLNINFCGDYGNAVWQSDGCSALAPTCSEWVANNPAAFANAYWDVNYIDAYVQTPGTANNGMPSSIPTATFTHLPGTAGRNGGGTRFLANGTFPKPTSPESTVTTTLTSITGTTTVTVLRSHIPTATLPPPTVKTDINPANLDEYSYLGCFGSSSNFESFMKVAEKADMSLEKCIAMCHGKKYAGIFDTGCYCATVLDADTRFCGGRLKNVGKYLDGIAAKANVTLPETASSQRAGKGNNTAPQKHPVNSKISKGNFTLPETSDVDNTTTKLNSTGPVTRSATSSSSGTTSTVITEVTIPVYPQAKESGAGPVRNSTIPPSFLRNSTMVSRKDNVARSLVFSESIQSDSLDRRDASNFLLTVYAAVAKEEPPKQPPGMGLHTHMAYVDSTSTIVTTVTYKTVHTLRPSEIVDAEYVTTIVEVHCGCTDHTSATVPMTTKVVPCSSCGPQGENHLTVTVPHTAIASPPPAIFTSKMPSGPTVTPPVVVGSAAGLKTTSLLLTTMLAMALLL
ncbi:hypothetical protein NQ176_g6259 [Zarea fungicola]|uniref:Uncharacterized protein n=1 Tax=Zarea fungicola TaxID=93591 RepID=A0ACC1N5Z9_9HYPO|nr:hypothetical protein NQ176_g6259 [Lecanicillium fungicola]